MDGPLLFDAVVFDLDGTLVATDRFWVQAARTGARRAFAELGIDRAIPDAAQWLGIVGLGTEEGFERLFDDLDPDARQAVLEACVQEETRLLAAGAATAMPGARETLAALSAEGLALGVASNCTQGYLDHMLAMLGARVGGAYCLESPGVRDKADMVAQLLRGFGTRAAVVVGDRSGDREAAWRNGVPHVHCAFGFASGAEGSAAEAEIEDLGELVPRLRGRAAWIEAALDAVGAASVRTLGITGGQAAGKTLFARDAARLLRARGREVDVVATDPPASRDRDGLERELGGVAPGTTLVVEGPELLDPWFRSRLDRVIHLEIPDEIRRRRLAGRALAEGGGTAGVGGGRSHRPPEAADLTLDASNPLGPPGGPIAHGGA